MKTIRWFGVRGIVIVCLVVNTGSPGNDAPRAQQPEKPVSVLKDLDRFFMQTAAADAKDGASVFIAAQGPVIVVEGFEYTLYGENGLKESFHGPVSPFNELKAVSHIGPCLFFIGQPYWRK